jgi:hypothetical protein
MTVRPVVAPAPAKPVAKPPPPRHPSVWDLPEAPLPNPQAAMRQDEKSRFKAVLTVGIAVGLLVLGLVVVWKFKKSLPKPVPGIAMHGMDENVQVGRFRFHVDSVEWREEATGLGGVTQRVLDVEISVTNLDSSVRATPVMVLGDRRGKNLAAEVGTPVLRTGGGRPIMKLEPGTPVQGHLIFQARLEEYCLIVSAGSGTEPPRSDYIRLVPRFVQPN